MATFRIKGQEVQVRLTRNGVLDRTIVDIKSASVTLKISQKLEGYLGRSSEDTDDQFDHVEGSIVVHPRSQDIILLARDIKLRAQRQIAQGALVINLIAKLTFPNGNRPTIIVPDLNFGDIPLNFPAREQYVDTTLSFVGSDYSVLTA